MTPPEKPPPDDMAAPASAQKPAQLHDDTVPISNTTTSGGPASKTPATEPSAASATAGVAPAGTTTAQRARSSSLPDLDDETDDDFIPEIFPETRGLAISRRSKRGYD